jgi:hypothetical protein
VLAVGAVDVVADIALVRPSVVTCVGLCARAITSMSVNVAVRVSRIDIVAQVLLSREAVCYHRQSGMRDGTP